MKKLKLLLSILLLTSVITVKAQENSFTDNRDGKTYKTVKIGEQVWMAENLAYLPSVNPLAENSETKSCYYVYDYDGTNVTEAKAADNYKTYGVLYNWVAAKKACPTGWHLPSDAEWTELINYFGDKNTAGDKLKEAGTTHWDSSNEGATNESGFTAFPGGYRDRDGSFNEVRINGYWWSSTEYDDIFAYSRNLCYRDSYLLRDYYTHDFGLSVRCVKD